MSPDEFKALVLQCAQQMAGFAVARDEANYQSAIENLKGLLDCVGDNREDDAGDEWKRG